ncbi:Methionine aminopeptidase 1D, mitochondrial [Allomyces arbusculus]|nr:Methionine aminopeptidase 1D, mitochondrial [Allomyces arbusculus]
MLRLAGSLVYEGATTATIDAAVHDAVVNAGAYPSPLLYQGSFPKSICTSINNVMAHGIPDERPLIAGDILNIDVTVYLNGFHGDCSAMFTVGQIDQAAMDLIAATRSALDAAIAACEPGAPFSVIAHAIGRVASEARFAVSPDMCGHGIGRDFHCAPIVHHVPTHAARDLTMEPGMAFTIEPILCHGSPAFVMWPDAWTVVTKDGGRSAQFEETLLVTEDGIEVVTKLDN